MSNAPFLHRFAPHVAELPVARRALRDWLQAAPRHPDAVQELLVVATELCTNAVRHAPAGIVTMRAWDEDDAVVLEVESLDRAHGGIPVVRNIDEPLAEGGRGMLIVRRLCDDVTIVVRGRNHIVRCRKWVPRRDLIDA